MHKKLDPRINSMGHVWDFNYYHFSTLVFTSENVLVKGLFYPGQTFSFLFSWLVMSLWSFSFLLPFSRPLCQVNCIYFLYKKPWQMCVKLLFMHIVLKSGPIWGLSEYSVGLLQSYWSGFLNPPFLSLSPGESTCLLWWKGFAQGLGIGLLL